MTFARRLAILPGGLGRDTRLALSQIQTNLTSPQAVWDQA